MPKKKTWPQLRFGDGSWMHNLKIPQTERREREKNEIETGMWSSVGLCNIGGVSECSLDLCAGVWNPQTTLTWCLTRDTGRPTSSSCWDATLFFSTQMMTGGSSWSLFICDWVFFVVCLWQTVLFCAFWNELKGCLCIYAIHVVCNVL